MAKKKQDEDKAVRKASPAGDLLPPGYDTFLKQLKGRIRSAQIRAALAVNEELLILYWQIGRDIASRQKVRGWGTKIIDRIADDLRKSLPGVEGFSRTNLYRMRAFYLAYGDAKEIVPQAVGQNAVELPPGVASLPWGHNVVLLEQLKNDSERLWYAQAAAEHGWSRAMLVTWIESDLHKRKGKAVTNFERTLPAPQSDLARETLKDPYSFDFLTLRDKALEAELEEGLLAHIQKFLLELGAGFAFVGQQVHLEVGGEDFYIDLLFYHLKLRCYVVLDLKMTAFKPEYAGKMNFYLSAVDDLLRHPEDKASIGIILCKGKNKVVAEYALRDVSKPVGVTSFVTKLVESLPATYKGSLPSPKELEAELSKDPSGK
jgi:predicted nuclease of restriction endonuclease-like (RecB) superfamily